MEIANTVNNGDGLSKISQFFLCKNARHFFRNALAKTGIAEYSLVRGLAKVEKGIG